MAPSTWLKTVQDRLAGKHPAAQVVWRTLLAGVVLAGIGAILGVLARAASTTPPAPSIVLFEVAAAPARFTQLAAELPDGATSLRGPLLADFLFIPAYTLTLALGALVLGPWGYRISALTGRAKDVAWVVVVAAGLNVVENLLLLWQIHAPAPNGPALAVTAAAAWSRVLLLGVASLYVLGALGGFLVRPGWIPPPGASDWTREPVTVPPAAAPSRRVLALSGGGVRSGTFALGVLQRLERGVGGSRSTELRWDDLDQVTSVSGGSYMAGAWLVSRPPDSSPAGALAGLRGAAPRPWARRSPDGVGPEELHLRVNLGYLLDPAPAAVPDSTEPAAGVTAPMAVGGGRTRQFPQPTPRGPAGGVATMLTGMLVNLAVLFVVLVAVSVPVGWIAGSALIAPMSGAGPGTAGTPEVPWDRLVPPVLVWVAAGVLFFVLWVAGRRLASTKLRWLAGLGSWAERRAWALGRVSIAISGALAVLLLLVPWAIHDLSALAGFGATVTWVRALTATAFVGTVIKTLRSLARTGPLKPWISRMGGLLLALIAAIVGGWFARSAAIAGPGNLPGPSWLSSGPVQAAVVVGLLVVYVATNPEWWAPASFYRGRLRMAYALRREEGDAGGGAGVHPWGGADEPLLADYAPSTASAPEPDRATHSGGSGTGPRLVVCTAANVSDRSEHTVYGLPAWSLTMAASELCLNRPVLGGPGAQRTRVATRWVERLWTRPDNPRLTVMAAVAMSGAAVAPGSGRFSRGSTNSFLALLNVRLGVWLPNPRHAAIYADAHKHYPYPAEQPGSAPAVAEPTRSAWPEFPRVRISYLLKELFGIFDPDDPYLYVTDGGHWENSAVVEQLRDQAALELVAVDGSGAAAGRMGNLADAMMLAYEEVGAQLQLDFRPFRLSSDGTSRAAGLGLLRYRESGELGLLWYVRPAITARVPALAAAYAEQNPAFPNEPTLDQFFSDLQFEAYREMGDHVAATLLQGREQLLATLRGSATLDDLRTVAGGAGEDLWAVRDLAGCLTDDDDAAAYHALRGRLLLGAPAGGPVQGADGNV